MAHRKTVILMWNPGISSVKESDFKDWFEGLCTFREKFFNWSVWDYEHVRYGDNFLLVRVGDDKSGLVMEGMVASDCYEGKDWAGSDRKRFYVDLVPMKAYSQNNGSVYPSQSQLQEAIPDFDWSGGHSGRLLTDNQLEKLDEFLKSFTASPEYSANDICGVRSRDYVIQPSLIHPSEEESERYPAVDPRPLIESLILQSMGIPAHRIEREWKRHENLWMHGREYLLRTAAWLTFPIRAELPYYGALCLKLALQYWGSCKNNINAAYAKEAADYLTDRKLRHSAIMIWLTESLRMQQTRGDGYAVSPLVRDKVTGLDKLSEFLGNDVLKQDDMLHDYSVRNVDIDIENDYIDIEVSYDPEDDEEDILTFHIDGNIEIDANFGSEGYQYIDGANIGAWGADKVQLLIDGYGLRARGQNIDISVKKPG